MGITVQQVGVLTCASRLCLRSLTRHRQLLDVELCWTQLRQVPELLYKKCHGSSPAVVVHHKHCCSYIGTAAIKHETRQQSSSLIGLQLQQPTAATGSYSKGLQLPSLPLPPSPVIPRRIPRDQRGGMQCETARGTVGINPDECRQTPRFTSTTRDRHIWDSTQLRQRRSGVSDTAGVTRGRRHHERWHRNTTGYFTIGRVPFLALHSDR